ncbi:MAG TPA: alpha-glucan family phosphorylase, partial [Planctomycetaceae bacterium]|nr:alpha-glucan family phosphorylase [Planctomycetaceae bacterium]
MAEHKTLYEKLSELASNLWWSWQPEVTSIFREIDPALWRQTGHNPVALLEHYPPERLEQTARELVLHSRVNWAYRRWREYMESDDTWGATHAGILGHRVAAYFSAEFGLHESMPIYSGGLGILAGDHLKSASDLGVPLVGVGLFYSEGYFSQRVTKDGWQQESPATIDVQKLPMQPARGKAGEPVVISVETRGDTIFARVWRVNVGRIPLFLLDTNVPENDEQDRKLTARLYGGDARTRVRQEIILGIGGVRALHALG